MKGAVSRNRKAREPEKNEPPKTPKTLVSTLLQLPPTSVSGMSQIDIMSNREAIIEGCRGVLEYNEDYIRLNLGNMSVRFCGRALQLRSLSEESVIIEGFIQSIEFIT